MRRTKSECDRLDAPRCFVSFTDPFGVRHSVEVAAESISEAAALDVFGAEEHRLADAIAPETELEVQVREPASCHRLSVRTRFVAGAMGSRSSLRRR
jgi:hypothetical protein